MLLVETIRSLADPLGKEVTNNLATSDTDTGVVEAWRSPGDGAMQESGCGDGCFN